MAIIDDLLVGLGFDYDPKDLEEFNSDIQDITTTIKQFAKVVIGGTAALVGFTAATTAATDRQGKLSKQTGVSVEQIDALEFALKRAGGSGESMATSLDQLAIRISETSRGLGSGIEAFGILGVSVTDANGKLKQTDNVMLEVADRLQGFSKAEQIELSDKLGLRDSILLLQEGSKGIRALTDEAKAFGVMSKEDAKLSEEFQDSLTDIFQIGKQLSRLIARTLVPVFEDAANGITEWFKANKDLIEQNIPKFVDGITLAFKLLTIAAVGFLSLKILSALASMITLFTTLGARAIIANLAIAAIPLLITGLVAAFGLLAADAKGFFEGQESFLGDMLKKYPQWNDEIIAVAATFATIADLTGMIFSGWGDIFNLFTSGTVIEDLLRNIRTMEASLKKAFEGLDVRKLFSDIWDDIIDDFSRTVIDPIVDKINGLKDALGFGDDKVVIKGELTLEDLNRITRPAGSTEGLEDLNRITRPAGSTEGLESELPPPEFLQGLSNNSKMFEGLSNDQDSNQISNQISGDTSSTNNNTNDNQVKIDLGGVTVNVENSKGDPQTSGKIIGESIMRELNPLLKQASIDLNSAVVI